MEDECNIMGQAREKACEIIQRLAYLSGEVFDEDGIKRINSLDETLDEIECEFRTLKKIGLDIWRRRAEEAAEEARKHREVELAKGSGGARTGQGHACGGLVPGRRCDCRKRVQGRKRRGFQGQRHSVLTTSGPISDSDIGIRFEF